MDQSKALEMIAARHSVRQYEEKPLSTEVITTLTEEIERINAENGLHIQLVTGEPKAFSSFLAHYGKFANVTDYLAMVGPKSGDLDIKCGYYGEQLVLLAQSLGLNSCWVKLTYKKVPEAFTIRHGEKLVCVIALGYGTTQGVPHRSKPITDLGAYEGNMPDWFRKGMEAAALAPTAVNQQKFFFKGAGNSVRASSRTTLTCAQLDLGIARCHFEWGAGKENFNWAD